MCAMNLASALLETNKTEKCYLLTGELGVVGGQYFDAALSASFQPPLGGATRIQVPVLLQLIKVVVT